MHKILLLWLLLILVGCSPAQSNTPPITKKEPATLNNEIGWNDFDSKIFIKSRLQNKLILIYLYSPNCTACERMELVTFSNPDVISLMNNFVCTKVNGNENDVFDNILDAKVYPTTIFLAPSGVYVIDIRGSVGPTAYKSMLSEILSVAKESGL